MNDEPGILRKIATPRRRGTWLCPTFIAILASCDGSTGPAGPGLEVGPRGGSVSFSAGTVELDFPTGAVSDPLPVTITRASTPPPDDALVPGTTFRFEPEGAVFGTAVRLTIRYEAEALPADVSESSLRLHRVTGVGWEPVEAGDVDAENDRVSGSIQGFGVYGVIGEIEEPQGTLAVTTSTAGGAVDPDGYDVLVDGTAVAVIGVEDQVALESLEPGPREVELAGLSPDCSVDGSNPRTVVVEAGQTRSTVFEVRCATPVGDLLVETSTTGEAQDPDGYFIEVDGDDPRAIGLDDEVLFDGLAEGDHTVELTGVSPNCLVAESNPRSVSVATEETRGVTFEVACSTPVGELRVETSTTGDSSAPEGYVVRVDGANPKAIGLDGAISFQSLSAGEHSVELFEVSSNCSVTSPNPRTVSVTANAETTTRFEVSCAEPTGDLRVYTYTTGGQLDPDGYTIVIDGGEGHSTGLNDQLLVEELTAGSHSIAIAGIASGCVLEGDNPVIVQVPADDTVELVFSILCETPPPPLPPRSVAVLGCSNTAEHTIGYDDESNLDLLLRLSVAQIGGETLGQWASNGRGWDTVESLEPEGGYEAAWVQICLRNTEHDGEMTTLHQTQIVTVVDRLEGEFGIPVSRIFISPLNFFADGTVCDLTGPEGPAVAAAIASWAVTAVGTVRGPDTGPLGPSRLIDDECHLNAAGRQFVGSQLVDFFDEGDVF